MKGPGKRRAAVKRRMSGVDRRKKCVDDKHRHKRRDQQALLTILRSIAQIERNLPPSATNSICKFDATNRPLSTALHTCTHIAGCILLFLISVSTHVHSVLLRFCLLCDGHTSTILLETPLTEVSSMISHPRKHVQPANVPPVASYRFLPSAFHLICFPALLLRHHFVPVEVPCACSGRREW